jgi:hypothetical protein
MEAKNFKANRTVLQMLQEVLSHIRDRVMEPVIKDRILMLARNDLCLIRLVIKVKVILYEHILTEVLW